MRVLAVFLALTASSPAVAGSGGNRFPIKAHPETAFGTPAGSRIRCPQTPGHFAGGDGFSRNEPLVPRKLTELPPATTYMAVFRHVGPCEVPLTMTEYRKAARR
jgi:hypothetical protein